MCFCEDACILRKFYLNKELLLAISRQVSMNKLVRNLKIVFRFKIASGCMSSLISCYVGTQEDNKCNYVTTILENEEFAFSMFTI